MLFELSIVPLARDVSLSDDVAKVLKIIDTSGLPYILTPTATCIEGEWEEVMDLIHRCHRRARERASHDITTVKIADEAGEQNKLVTNVETAEARAGKPLRRLPS